MYFKKSRDNWRNYHAGESPRLSMWVNQDRFLVRQYIAERERLIALREELQNLGPIPDDAANILRFTVAFMNSISKFQDGGILACQPRCKEGYADVFNNIIKHCGHQPKKNTWNQSNLGEEVTLDNVFFGAFFGLPVKPARYWISCPKSKTVSLAIKNPLIAQHPEAPLDVFKDVGLLQCMKKAPPKKEIWVTDAIVFHGKYNVSRFIKTNLEITFEALAGLLE